MRRLVAGVDDVFAFFARRGPMRDEATEKIVRDIIEDVRHRGDLALLENARRFDAPELKSIAVDDSEIYGAQPSEEIRYAIDFARTRISLFHFDQLQHLTGGWSRPAQLRIETGQRVVHDLGPPGHFVWTRPGTHLGQRWTPLQSAGIYVPGGEATYPSSVLMNGIPGEVAAVGSLVFTTPARRDGSLHPAVLYALRSFSSPVQAFKIGGAAAIAALALGTETVPRVDKVVGPGNRFVNEAKRQLWGQVGLDGYAGPSEVCVLADDDANAAFAAADLLTQVEHAPDNAGFLVTLSVEKEREILAELERQLTSAPRAETMRRALADHGVSIVARDLAEAIDIVNAIAPEHLTLSVRDAEKALSEIQNAGCILLGEHSPESAGDYCAGPSHTLPTAGAARWQSPVNVLDFVKLQSVIGMRPDELEPLIPVIETLAEIEGFPAHGFGASIRKPSSR